MPQYAKETTVSKDRSLAEIEQILTRYGASGFAYGWSGNDAMVGFTVSNRMIRLIVPLPDRNSKQFTHTPGHNMQRTKAQAQQAYEQAVRQRWRALTLYVKATLEAVEAGIVTFDDAFLAYTALPNGGTVGQWMQPQIDDVYRTGTMPRLLPMLTSDE
jgi:hypothetical protein